MKIEDCKVGMKVIIVRDTDKGDVGTVSEIDLAANLVYVFWETGNDRGDKLHVSVDRIEPFVEQTSEPKFTIAEINAILDEIEEDSDDLRNEEWYTTDRIFTSHGLDKVREYFKEKYQKPDLKAQALSKLTPEEIEALGIKL